jgi:peptidoglycan/LPS O-acetylase OafA/YrhL
MQRLDQLTFTRFAVILLVLFYHGTAGFYVSFVDNPAILALLRSAPTGVSYLYVLSGFVMSLVYFRPNEKFDLGGYWRARFIRIYPLYIIAFLLICYYYLEGVFDIKPQKILANVFVLQAWIPAYSQSFNYASWSLTVEFFFYTIFPFFVLWACRRSTRSLVWLAVVFWVISQAVYYVLWMLYFPEYRGFIVYSPIFHLNSFIMGVVGGIWYLREGRQQEGKPVMVLSVLAGSVFFAVAYTIISTVYDRSLPHNLQPMGGLLAPFLVLIIVSLAMDKSRLSHFLNHSWLVTLGEISYAVYILHVPIAWLYERALEHSSLANPRSIFEITFLPLIISIGLIAHFYIDSPLRKWLRNTLRQVGMRLLIIDLALIAASVYISFRFRFGDGREFNRYWDTAQIMFWSAFILRTIFSTYFKSFDPANLRGTFWQLARPVLLSVTVASLPVAGVVYLIYSLGWIENFPRSIFLIDWIILLGMSLIVRLVFRALKVYKLDPVPV